MVRIKITKRLKVAPEDGVTTEEPSPMPDPSTPVSTTTVTDGGTPLSNVAAATSTLAEKDLVEVADSDDEFSFSADFPARIQKKRKPGFFDDDPMETEDEKAGPKMTGVITPKVKEEEDEIPIRIEYLPPDKKPAAKEPVSYTHLRAHET